MKLLPPILLALGLLLSGCATASFSGLTASIVPVGNFAKVEVKTATGIVELTDVRNDGKTLTYSGARVTALSPWGISEIDLTPAK